MVFVRNLDQDRVELRCRGEGPHVDIEVRRMDSHGCGPLDLCANFTLRLLRLCVCGHWAVVGIEIAVRIQQACHPVTWRYRPPAVGLPFPGERQMKTDVG